MRLTNDEQQAIREEVIRVFGRDAFVRLFGSRVDDQARGGDIDLHIEAPGSPAELLERELRPKARFMRRLGERRIDVVVYNGEIPLRTIDRHARQTKIAL